MKNNNFFKLTKSKIIISVILLLLGLGALYILFSINPYVEKGGGSFINNSIFWIILLPILSIMVLNSSLISGWLALVIIIALQLLYIYLISCILVWIYNKIMKKR